MNENKTIQDFFASIVTTLAGQQKEFSPLELKRFNLLLFLFVHANNKIPLPDFLEKNSNWYLDFPKEDLKTLGLVNEFLHTLYNRWLELKEGALDFTKEMADIAEILLNYLPTQKDEDENKLFIIDILLTHIFSSEFSVTPMATQLSNSEVNMIYATYAAQNDPGILQEDNKILNAMKDVFKEKGILIPSEAFENKMSEAGNIHRFYPQNNKKREDGSKLVNNFIELN